MSGLLLGFFGLHLVFILNLHFTFVVIVVVNLHARDAGRHHERAWVTVGLSCQWGSEEKPSGPRTGACA